MSTGLKIESTLFLPGIFKTDNAFHRVLLFR